MERQLRAGGGIMTLEEPRQGYFLGKIVKKAKRAVKKVVKSPIGKLAILGGLGAYAGGLGPFANLKGAGFLKGSMGNLLTGLKSKEGFLGTIGNAFRVGGDPTKGFSGLRMLGGGLGAAAIAAPFLMGGDEEVEEDTSFTETPDSISSIVNMARNQDPSLRFLPKPKFVDNFYAADGGLADIPREGYESGERVSGILKLLSRLTPAGAAKELGSNMDIDILKKLSMFTPAGAAVNFGKKIANMKDGGIMDLGGLEKDYREGGFVPLGEEERADDVPARLSKNEFVFTADAVRAAGQGDIDKGAEVMQNMMDNLEAGGTISEESQGMNPAQEMFDQSQMLESRIV